MSDSSLGSVGDRGLGRVFSAAVQGLNSVGTLWIFALMVLINLDVLSRYLFNAPIQGVTEIVELSIVAIVFLQVGDATRAGRLTRSDGLYTRVMANWPSFGHAAGAVFDLCGAAFFVCILLGAGPRLVEAYRGAFFAGNEGLFVVPVWPIRLIIVIGCVVTALQFLVLARRHLDQLLSTRARSA